MIPHTGPCKYQLAGASAGSVVPYFVIYIKTDEEAHGPALVQFIDLELETNIIRLNRGGTVSVSEIC